MEDNGKAELTFMILYCALMNSRYNYVVVSKETCKGSSLGPFVDSAILSPPFTTLLNLGNHLIRDASVNVITVH